MRSSTKPKSFAEQVDASRQWEVRLGDFLRRRGWFIVPAYDFSGKGEEKAPKMLAPPNKRSLVLPDLQCFSQRHANRWIEVKVKDHAEWYRIGQHLTTGFNLRHWDHYHRVEELSAAEVTVVFVHESEREIRAATLTQLREEFFSHEYKGPLMGPHGMVFFRYDDIPLWGSLETVYR